ncbi:MAG: hypothetical protein KKA42_12920, partial [candidate division Zixibacteria bacterium]|nr:hypothetical protein [candidate division Zixibacteria bacterium]
DGDLAFDNRFNCENGPWTYWATIATSAPPSGPANNNCADATPIGDVTNEPWSTTIATASGLGTYIYSADVFFCYTATCDGIATASLCGSSFDTKIAVYDGCVCTGVTVLATNDDACGVASEVDFPVVAGQTYLIQCGGYSTATGDGVLTTSCEYVSPLVNDDCADAIPAYDGETTWNNAGATTDGPAELDCFSSYQPQVNGDIWYTYTATCDGALNINTCGTNRDTKLAVYAGTDCPPTAAPIACDDDGCDTGENGGSGLASKVTIGGVTTGDQFLIRVGLYSATTAQGDGVLNIECFTPPWNDLCDAVTPVVLSDGVEVQFLGDNSNSTADCALLGSPVVWLAFTIEDTCMDVELNYCGTIPAFGNAFLNLVYGCPCDSLTDAGTYEFTCGGFDDNVVIRWSSLFPGTYYYGVLLDPAYGAQGPYSIQVTGTTAECIHCSAGSNLCDEYIERVQVGDIDNSTYCDDDDNYDDYSAMSTLMWKRLSYDFTITGGNTYSSDQVGVWVDWNQDLFFDGPDESIYVNGSPGPGPDYTGTITPPTAAVVGPARMRVRITWNTAPTPCGFDSYGEVEDYTIMVDEFECGDCSGDDVVDMNDIMCMENFYFFFGAAPVPLISGDANCDGYVNIADIVYISDYLYRGGPAPCCVP